MSDENTLLTYWCVKKIGKLPEIVGVLTDICFVQLLNQIKLTSDSFYRALLILTLLILVKSPDSFSEEHLLFNRLGSFSSWGEKSTSIQLQGKRFSFIVLNPAIAERPDINNSLVSALKHGFSLEINSDGKLSSELLSSFLTKYNPALNPGYAFRIATIYKEEAQDEGVNSDVAFSQMCLETAYLKFGGDVLPGQNNFCGLGVVGGGVKGASFSDIRAGIRAHIQHLKAYASDGHLANPVVDKRFKYVKRGSATDVHKLTGKWAVDKNYGKKINHLLTMMYADAGV